MTWSPGASGALTHMNFFFSVNDFLFDITCQSVENSSRHILGDPELTEDQGCQDGQEGELVVRVAAPLRPSVDRLLRVWKNVALDFPADQYEDLPVLGRGVSGTTAAEVGALHFLLSVASLLWCADFAVQLNLGGVAHMEELFFFVHGDLGNTN